MFMEELRRLPEQIPSLRDCAFYVSGFNPVVDNVLMPLGMGVMKLSPRRLGRPYARLLAWALRRYCRPPYGTVWQLEAEGVLAEGPLPGRAATGAAGGAETGADAAGGAVSVGLRLMHPDGYWLTAAAAAACLLQWLDGSLREPGVHLQALAVDPARLLRDLRRMGVQIAGHGVDVSALVGEGRR
jgi:hypothetical protein